MGKKGAIELSAGFLIMLIIAIVVFSFGIYFVKQFFAGATDIKNVYDERAEKEIERLLDDGSKVAIPFDKKEIGNGEFGTFGIGILNVIGEGLENSFRARISFNKAYNPINEEICSSSTQQNCGSPDSWLQTTDGNGQPSAGVQVSRTIKNNEQEKFLVGVNVKNAPKGTYIFDVRVCVSQTDAIPNDNNACPVSYFQNFPDPYDTLKKIYVQVK